MGLCLPSGTKTQSTLRHVPLFSPYPSTLKEEMSRTDVAGFVAAANWHGALDFWSRVLQKYSSSVTWVVVSPLIRP